MSAGRDADSTPQEQAALVALLRERPGSRGWAEIMAAVLEAGSARAVWDLFVPPVLVRPRGSLTRWTRPPGRSAAGRTGDGGC